MESRLPNNRETRDGTFETQYTTTLVASKLEVERNGESIIHPVGRINGIFWWLYFYYNGDAPQNKGSLIVKLFYDTTESLNVDAKFTVKDKTLPFRFRYSKKNFFGLIKITHQELRDMGAIVDNKIEIVIDATFTVPGTVVDAEQFRPLPPASVLTHELLDANRTHLNDAVFVVGENKEEITVNRAFLSLISPVFEAMFSNKTKEAATGRIDVIDFDYETVKDVLDICYGYTYKDKTTLETLDVLRFSDKYEIIGVFNKLNTHLGDSINEYNFFHIVKYAWMYELEQLKSKCRFFFKQNEDKIRKNTELDNVAPEAVQDMTSN
uniref:BTB domain-containing protein n=1 Tax=Panagrellus redivivus TaxID=6233 RepID=A0A7E4VRI9_PANRE